MRQEYVRNLQRKNQDQRCNALITEERNGQIHKYTRDFSTPLSITKITGRQKGRKVIEELNNDINKLDLIAV